jgi:hypothetical protein
VSRKQNVFRTVEVRVWDDEKFAELSNAKPNAQTLWLFLLTAPQSVAFPGFFYFSIGETAERFSWPRRKISQHLEEILSKGMAKFDPDRRIIWLPKSIEKAPLFSLNQAKAWGLSLSEFPECSLRNQATVAVQAITDAKGHAFRHAFDQGLARTLVHTQSQSQSYIPPTPHGGVSLPAGEEGDGEADQRARAAEKYLELLRRNASVAPSEGSPSDDYEGQRVSGPPEFKDAPTWLKKGAA